MITNPVSLSKMLFFKIIDKIVSHNKTKSFFSPNLRAIISMLAGRRDMDDIQTVYEFWDQEKPQNNYFGTPDWSERSETILRALDSYLNKDDIILEIGCNAGRNLNHLYNAGVHNLKGIEISQSAVNRLRENYHCLKDIDVDVGPAEKILKQY